jgi:hypothetical protein
MNPNGAILDRACGLRARHNMGGPVSTRCGKKRSSGTQHPPYPFAICRISKSLTMRILESSPKRNNEADEP